MDERSYLAMILNSLHFSYVRGDISAMKIRRIQRSSMPWSSNPFTLITQIAKGGVIVELEELTFEVQAGQALIIPAHARYKITILEEPTLSQWLNIDFTVFEHFPLFDLIRTPYPLSASVGNKIGHLQNKIIGCMNIDSIDPREVLLRAAKAKKLVFELLELILSHSNHDLVGIETLNKYRRFHPVLIYIENHLDQKIAISSLAEILHLSTSHFYKEFKEAFQMAPLQYIQAQRLKKSQYLLASTDLTMDEIASRIGYRDAFQFLRFFKLKSGSSPSQYKKTMMNNPMAAHRPVPNQ